MSAIRRFVRQVGVYMARLQRRANLGAPDAGQMPDDIRVRPNTLASWFKQNQATPGGLGPRKHSLSGEDTQGDGWLRQVISKAGYLLRIPSIMNGLFLILMALLLFGGNAFIKIVVAIVLVLRGLKLIFSSF